MAIRRACLSGVVGLQVTTLLALLSAPATAQSTNGGREIRVSILGSSNRFSQPVRTVDDLHAMVMANWRQLTHVLTTAGLGNLSTQVLDTLAAGHVTETTIAPGTQIRWMAIKRSGTPVVLNNVRWTGGQSFRAWQFAVSSSGMIYDFIVPMVCGNLSLLTVSPARRLTEAPAPPPPPAVVDRTPPPPPPAYAPTTTYSSDDDDYRPWLASGFIGTSLDTSTDLVSENDVTNGVAFGGQIAYLWRERVGGEFLATFAPSVGFGNVFLADTPHVNTYMGNVIGSWRFGDDGQFRPYASGGVGAIALHTTVFTSARGIDTTSTNVSRFGANIGGGLMVFSDHFGIRGDVRRYSATTSNDVVVIRRGSPGDLTRALLSGLSFWTADVGVAFRW